MALAACGSSESSKGAKATSSSKFTSASLTNAKEGIKPFIGKPTPVPISTRLAKLPEKGKTVVFFNCGDAECEEYIPGLTAATKALGYKLKVVTTGLTPATVSAAADAAAQLKPAGIVDPGIEPSLFRGALKTFEQEKVPVIAIAIPGTTGKGITGILANRAAIVEVGEHEAQYVYTQEGNSTDAVFVDVPEIQLSFGMEEGFAKEMHALCSSCEVSQLKVSASTIGSTLPGEEVSYLQKNPKVNWLANFAGSLAIGVPQALKAAGVTIDTISQSGGPTNMEYLKKGEETANLATDNNEWGWLAMDMIARENNGEGIPSAEQGVAPPQQLLTQKYITFNPSEGWTVKGFEGTFKKLWGLE